MVDLTGQYERIKAEIDQAIHRVLDSGAFIKGPEVKQFEFSLASYLGISKVISCGNGTDALQIAMMALDLEPGDEIITTPFTFVATVEVIQLLKLKPVFADINPDTFNIDASSLEALISPRTKAIVPVHLFGQCCDMESVLRTAEKHRLFVIEDSAQNLGGNFTFKNGAAYKSGTMGNIGCTSFFPSKNLGTYGDGGAIFTSDQDLALKIQAIVNHGMIQRYHYDYVGVNSRLDTLQAAILNIKLKYLDQYNQSRQKAADFYNESFSTNPFLEIPVKSAFSNHIYHQYTLRIKDGRRDALKTYLEKAGIPSMIYYPLPLHLQKAYDGLGYKKGDFPIAENTCKEVLSLPMHTELDFDQLSFICERVLEFLN